MKLIKNTVGLFFGVVALAVTSESASIVYSFEGTLDDDFRQYSADSNFSLDFTVSEEPEFGSITTMPDSSASFDVISGMVMIGGDSFEISGEVEVENRLLGDSLSYFLSWDPNPNLDPNEPGNPGNNVFLSASFEASRFSSTALPELEGDEDFTLEVSFEELERPVVSTLVTISSFDSTVVPEPSTLILLSGLLPILGRRRR